MLLLWTGGANVSSMQYALIFYDLQLILAPMDPCLPHQDHGVGHFVEMTSQKGLQPGSFLAIFSHDIHA